MLRLRRALERARESLWALPAALLLGFVALAAIAVGIDRSMDTVPAALTLYGGSAEGARTILATIATSMLSLAVLVFSITLVVLQLASSQLTPRIMPLFLQDPASKVAMGVFLGTFAYALVGLWFVRTPTDRGEEFVPFLLVTLAFVAVAVSLLTFLNYVHRVAQSIRVETVVSTIARQTLAAIEDDPAFSLAEEPPAPAENRASRPAAPPVPGVRSDVPASTSGLIVGISPEAAVRWARDHDAVVEVLHPLGRFVTEGMPLVRVLGVDQADFPLDDVVSLGRKRLVSLDPAYGVHELVEIAVRALSPGVNEPGIAVVVLDSLHRILERVGSSALSGPGHLDEEEVLRAIVPRLTWDGWVAIALREIIDYGGESTQVCHRTAALLDALLGTLPTARHDVLNRYRAEIADLPAAQRSYAEWSSAPTQ